MSNTAIPLSPAQLAIIRQHGNAQNYPLMYRYIADEIAAGRIAVANFRVTNFRVRSCIDTFIPL